MRLTKFDFHAPESLSEGLEVLARNNGEAKILAGGTDLIVGMKQGVSRPQRVVWLGKINELQKISFTSEGGLRLGAMCRLNDIERNEFVLQSFPSLAGVVRSIASPQIRNRATIGGNLCLNTRCFYYDQSEFWRGSLGYCLKSGDGICHAAPGLSSCSAVLSSDLAPFLMALNASVRIAGTAGEKILPLSDFYVDDGMHHLKLRRGEILAEVIIPSHSMKLRTAFEKLRHRGSIDYPLVNVATCAIVDPDNVITTIQVVVGAVQSMPVNIKASEAILLGQRLTRDVIEHAAEAAVGSVAPLPNVVQSVSYRKFMVKQLVKKSLIGLTWR